jgi:hypothetical protein
MYIKVHESRQSRKSYLLQYRLALNNGQQDKFVIENEEHKSFIVVESELFNTLDKFFKGKQNERQEERVKNDGQENQRV